MRSLKFDSRIVNVAFLIGVVFLVLLGLTQSGFFSGIAFVLCAVYFVFLREDIVIADLFFLLPFATIFKMSSESTSFMTILLLWVMLVFVVKRGGRLKLTPIIRLGFFFVAFVAVADLIRGGFRVTELLKHVSGILFIYFILENKEEKSHKDIILFFGSGLYLSSFIALFANSIPNFYEYVRQIGYNATISNRFTGMNGDPNYYTICLVLVLLGALTIINHNKLFFWISFFSTCFFGVQTYSKSFLLAIMFTFIIIAIDMIKRKNNKFAAVLFILVALIIVILSLSGKFASVDFILNRFTDSNNLSDLTTGRSEIWVNYLAHITRNLDVLLIGEGISSPQLDGRGSHNFFIELWYYLGFVGFSLFVSVIVLGYKKSVGNNRNMLTSGKACAFIVICLYFALQALFYNELYFHIVFVYVLCMENRLQMIKEN